MVAGNYSEDEFFLLMEQLNPEAIYILQSLDIPIFSPGFTTAPGHAMKGTRNEIACG
jgi:hypothetical protein